MFTETANGRLVRSRFVTDGSTIITHPGRRPIVVTDVQANPLSRRVTAIAEGITNGRVVLGYLDDVVEVVA